MTPQLARLLDRDALQTLRELHPGRTIGLCNGAFDLLHVGHLRYLTDAARMVDVLVVAVNADSSVRGLKGPTRPIVPEDERVEMLQSVRGVDYVHVFTEPNVNAVLQALRPNLHIKGRDYTPDTIPEAPMVRALGGDVAVAGDPKDHATTDIIARITAAGAAEQPRG